MDIFKFNEIMNSLKPTSLQQEPSEWRMFLEIIDTYFKNRGITYPLVVEIGLYNNLQKRFYESLFNTEHIGIDINWQPDANAPDILGDSHSVETVEKLKILITGRMIDVLFIDGNHSYESVKRDYELYAPLTRHIIALHDIHTTKLYPRDSIGVIEFWQELIRTNTRDTMIEIRHHNPKEGRGVFNPGRQMGIGLIIKDRR